MASYPAPRLTQSYQRQDDNGWQPEGFAGHRVTQAGIGWVLRDVPQHLRAEAVRGLP